MRQWNTEQLRARLLMLPVLIPVQVRHVLIASAMVMAVTAVLYSIGQQLLLQGQTTQKTLALHALLAPQIEAKTKTKEKKIKKKPGNTVATKSPTLVTTASVMTQLRTMAENNKLRIRELSTDVRQQQDGNRLSVEMEARGSYAKIKSLLFGLQQRYSQLRLEKIRIEKHKRGSLVLWLRFSPGLLERG